MVVAMAAVGATMATFAPSVVIGLGSFSSGLEPFRRAPKFEVGVVGNQLSLSTRNWRTRILRDAGRRGLRKCGFACELPRYGNARGMAVKQEGAIGNVGSSDSACTVRGENRLNNSSESGLMNELGGDCTDSGQPRKSPMSATSSPMPLNELPIDFSLEYRQRLAELGETSPYAQKYPLSELAPKLLSKLADLAAKSVNKRTEWVNSFQSLKGKFSISAGKPSDILVFLTSFAIVLSVMTTGLDSHAFVAAPPRKLQREELATVQLFKDNTPSVVYITNLAVRRDVFTLDVMAVPQGSGSGFIWDKQGHIVTNYHVIRGASDLRVTLGDQSVYEADVVGYDEDKDVAVLHIDAPEDKLRPLPVGSSSDLLVGQKVFAIGNPFGLDHTLTTGVISGLRREISSAATGRPIQDVIQTDAAINPGNSGGPLLDSSGNLIGINTAIYSPSGTSSGVGFSIPVDTVSGIVEQIVKFGKVTRPVLGISFAPEQSVEQLGVTGVLVLDAPPTGPAGKAGLRPTTRDSYGRLVLGDVITSLNGQKVTNGSDLYKILDRCKVGDTVEVEILRGDKISKVPVTLEARE
ncbi:protease Do-like 1, chloroplastic [Marchantia polymorpha subsp. ruderalis]|uniref:PDZ domain-containing protein n=2 Tax=Marchantia polymorpha TaxID=3197 RepID=A0A176WLN3_MARPO|nr:hypothetical protein AXG93_4280s1190 [Marchantia polymorpha subsp. ruderalis]PTQ49180.1 hypothetical protein MARPO_0003s0078 [Marchantia polymorpha]BBN16937.1 hypothetical protein Mp_7g10590 [Marchantia polymorpha subsp. ruderalis]|eukprot:PTQ49180.1 hypothetical protein MARPO_0003s0078 [Marchantia polymorpha]